MELKLLLFLPGGACMQFLAFRLGEVKTDCSELQGDLSRTTVSGASVAALQCVVSSARIPGQQHCFMRHQQAA